MPTTQEDSAARKPVLIVDDDPDVRESLRDFLEDEGYRVLTAANGREGLEVLATMHEMPVLLLDLMMPVMGGWDVMTTLGCQESVVPVIVLSAAADGLRVLNSGARR